MVSDTSVKNADGVDIWYDFDGNTKTVSVTYKGTFLVHILNCTQEKLLYLQL